MIEESKNKVVTLSENTPDDTISFRSNDSDWSYTVDSKHSYIINVPSNCKIEGAVSKHQIQDLIDKYEIELSNLDEDDRYEDIYSIPIVNEIIEDLKELLE